MVSYEDLIYCFTDIYLKTAMECSICQENYTMTDNLSFLDEYMKFFGSLLTTIERDDTLELSVVKQTLEKRKAEKLEEFQRFFKNRIIEKAVETAQALENNDGVESVTKDSLVYIEKIQQFYDEIFSDDVKWEEMSPVELLCHIRTKEESL